MYYTHPEKCILQWSYNLWLSIQKGESISRSVPILLGDPHLVITQSCVTSPGISLLHWSFCQPTNLPDHMWPGLDFCIPYWKGLPRQSSWVALSNVIIINQECIILNASFMPEKLHNFKKFSCLSQPSVWSRWMSPRAHNPACYHSRRESYLEQHSRSASSVSSNY